MKQFTVKELSVLYQVDTRAIVKCADKWGGKFVASGIRYPGWIILSPPSNQPVMKPCHVAKLMSVSHRVVSRWCRSGVVKAFKIGKLWRIDYADGVRLILKRKLGFNE